MKLVKRFTDRVFFAIHSALCIQFIRAILKRRATLVLIPRPPLMVLTPVKSWVPNLVACKFLVNENVNEQSNDHHFLTTFLTFH